MTLAEGTLRGPEAGGQRPICSVKTRDYSDDFKQPVLNLEFHAGSTLNWFPSFARRFLFPERDCPQRVGLNRPTRLFVRRTSLDPPMEFSLPTGADERTSFSIRILQID